MKQQVKQIVGPSDYLLLYSAGTGGEFLTSTISECVASLNTIGRVDKTNNRWNAVCKVGYSDIVKRDGTTYIQNYVGENDPDKNNIFKDHPVDTVMEIWPKHVKVLYVCVTENYDYWAQVTWNKLHNVNITVPKQQFLKDHANTIQYEYEHRKKFADYFDIFYDINISTVADDLQQIFPDLNKPKFEELYKTWIQKNEQ